MPVSEFVTAEFQALDERFRYLDGDFVLERLHSGARKSEGPVYFPAARCLVWSDIPNDRLLRWDETTGTVGVFRQPSGYANGNTVDRQGRLVTCEQGNRRVTRTEHDGTVTVLADGYDGKRLNSPNDVVVRADGTIWFTDPIYGIHSDYEGNKAEPEFAGACYVFRLDPATGELKVVAEDFCRPNGLAFSPDEQRLYIADTRQEPSHLRVFDVTADGTLSGGGIFAVCDNGRFDGLRVDDSGRVWAAAWDGIHCFDTDGTRIGRLLVPEPVANLTFGGPKRNQLFITAGRSLYTLRVTFNGARYPETSRPGIPAELGVATDFDPHREAERRVAFLADALAGAGLTTLVLGISGGVDSSAAGRLCQLAVERLRGTGKEATFIAMRLPYGIQHDEDDAQAALAFIRPDRIMTTDIRPASDASLHSLEESDLGFRDARQRDFVLGNIKARQRMVAQYAVAGATGGLVVGTDHAAEAVTGFFTKHGDGAADLVPLAGLTKRRVRAIARALGAPPPLVDKVPTADLESLEPGKPDEHALGLSYDDIDDFLEGRPVAEEVAEAIRNRFHDTAHKRRLPSAPGK